MIIMRTHSDSELVLVVDPTVKVFSYDGKPRTTALELLRQNALKDHVSVSTVKSEHGEMVTRINGYPKVVRVRNSGWIFEVDGSIPEESAANYQTSSGERISWKYVHVKRI